MVMSFDSPLPYGLCVVYAVWCLCVCKGCFSYMCMPKENFEGPDSRAGGAQGGVSLSWT